jgi:hypothetical protein
MWSANSRFHASLGHESVALKTGKMRANRVISQVESVRKLVYRALAGPQKLKDFPPGTFEQAVAPAYILH